MTVFATKGSGVGNHSYVRSSPCGYPEGAARYEEDAIEVAFRADLSGDGNTVSTPLINTKVGCLVAVHLVYEDAKQYSITFTTGTGTLVSGPSLPYDSEGNGSVDFVFEVTAVGTGGVQLRIDEGAAQACAPNHYDDPDVAAEISNTLYEVSLYDGYTTGVNESPLDESCWASIAMNNVLDGGSLTIETEPSGIEYRLYNVVGGSLVVPPYATGTIIAGGIVVETTQGTYNTLAFSPLSGDNVGDFMISYSTPVDQQLGGIEVIDQNSETANFSASPYNSGHSLDLQPNGGTTPTSQIISFYHDSLDGYIMTIHSIDIYGTGGWDSVDLVNTFELPYGGGTMYNSGTDLVIELDPGSSGVTLRVQAGSMPLFPDGNQFRMLYDIAVNDSGGGGGG